MSRKDHPKVKNHGHTTHERCKICLHRVGKRVTAGAKAACRCTCHDLER